MILRSRKLVKKFERHETSEPYSMIQWKIQEKNELTPKALHDYATTIVMDTILGIKRPSIPTNNFESKPAIIHMIEANQFDGFPIDDPNAHIISFLEIFDTFKHNGITDDVIRLRLFPFSLRDKAKS